MTPQARVQAAIDILDAIIEASNSAGAAADTLVQRYFRTRRYAGSKDRRAVREHVYDALRLIGAQPVSGRAAMLGVFEAMGDAPLTAAIFDGSAHGPEPVRDGEPVAKPLLCPKWLSEHLVEMVDKTELAAFGERAPLDLRVNTLKATRDEVAAAYPDAVPVAGLPDARRLPADTRITDDAAYKDGLVEIQDAGSQLVVLACDARPGMVVLDLCAGGGGKTLALASAMENKGRLIASDAIRPRLAPLIERAARGGADVETRLLNAAHETEALADLEGACDRVLVDAPCSGTGTWRRNPEGRWRVSPKMIARHADEQARLLDIAARCVEPGGKLIYAVCALTRAEGPNQIARFLSRHSGWSADDIDIEAGRRCGGGIVLTPAHDACDGFFFARLSRNDELGRDSKPA